MFAKQSIYTFFLPKNFLNYFKKSLKETKLRNTKGNTKIKVEKKQTEIEQQVTASFCLKRKKHFASRKVEKIYEVSLFGLEK